jgi:hypothetical protein
MRLITHDSRRRPSSLAMRIAPRECVWGTACRYPENSNQLLVSGGATITAANGDKLQAVLANAVLDPTTGIGKGGIQIVGGTGRFEGAGGSADFVVEQNLATGAFETTWIGNINF